MKLIALDPSSTRTGYAAFIDGKLAEAGYLKPHRTRDSSEKRIEAMCNALRELFIGMVVDGVHVVVEVPSDRQGTGSRAGATGRLAIYGVAVGELRRTAKCSVFVSQVHSVTEREWTRGRSKARRQAGIAALFPNYRRIMAKDRGADVADAIGLGLWWLAKDRRLGYGNRAADL